MFYRPVAPRLNKGSRPDPGTIRRRASAAGRVERAGGGPAARGAGPGFTLVELLLVVTIIGVLAALVVPRFVGRSQQARETAARQEIVGTLGVALDLFEQDLGRYPTVEEGLAVLISLPSGGGNLSNWHGPYLKSAAVPRDPWGNEYRYAYPSELTDIASLYDVVSAGPDGQFGTDDDITNHNADQAGEREAESRYDAR